MMGLIRYQSLKKKGILVCCLRVEIKTVRKGQKKAGFMATVTAKFYKITCRRTSAGFCNTCRLSSGLLTSANKNYMNTVVHDFNGHDVNGKHGFNGKKCYDGGFYVINNGKIDV